MSFRVVIPARFASSRLPGKPLLDLGGKPMIVRVAEQAARSGARGVIVATDDERVLRAVEGARIERAEAVLTRADHPSGSDRVMEVAAGWPDEEVVVNVQGDEPLVPPAVIDQVAALLREASPQPGPLASERRARGLPLARKSPCSVATLCEPIACPGDVFDPNIVKVVVDAQGRALYFSRAPVPWSRAAFSEEVPVKLAAGWQRHIGIYAYRVDALREFVSWPVGHLERVEALEQLRLLERGRGIAVAEAVAPVPGGVDTPADAERVRRILAG